jgi:hypothetical protein
LFRHRFFLPPDALERESANRVLPLHDAKVRMWAGMNEHALRRSALLNRATEKVLLKNRKPPEKAIAAPLNATQPNIRPKDPCMWVSAASHRES